MRITETLHQRGFIEEQNAKSYSVTSAGRDWFESLEIKLPLSAIAQKKSSQKNIARRCLDWTERRHHLAGPLGCALYKRFRELGWIVPIRDTRAVRVTVEGRLHLWNLLRVSVG